MASKMPLFEEKKEKEVLLLINSSDPRIHCWAKLNQNKRCLFGPDSGDHFLDRRRGIFFLTRRSPVAENVPRGHCCRGSCYRKLPKRDGQIDPISDSLWRNAARPPLGECGQQWTEHQGPLHRSALSPASWVHLSEAIQPGGKTDNAPVLPPERVLLEQRRFCMSEQPEKCQALQGVSQPGLSTTVIRWIYRYPSRSI